MIKLLKRIWAGWKRIAKAIGDFQAAVLLTIIYWLVTGPMSLISRLGGGGAEFRNRDLPSYWTTKPSSGMSEAERLDHQF